MANDKLIITIPLIYTSLVHPNEFVFSTKFENQSSISSIDEKFPLEIDNFNKIRLRINEINKIYSPQDIIVLINEFKKIENKITISIMGNNNNIHQNNIYQIRKLILNDYYQLSEKNIYLTIKKFNYLFNATKIDNNDTISYTFKTDFLQTLLDISNYYSNDDTIITVIASNNSSLASHSIISPDNKIDYIIKIYAKENLITSIENKIRLLIDDMNPLSFCDYLEIDHLSLLPLIGGTKFSNFKQIIKQTNCHLYLPNLLPQLYSNDDANISSFFDNNFLSPDNKENNDYTNNNNNNTNFHLNIKPKIYITGIRSMIILTKKLINDIIENISKTPFIKKLSILSIKRESLILFNNNHEFIKNIIYNTGCFIKFENLGYVNKIGSKDQMINNNNNTTDLNEYISFQGNSIEDVENCIEKFMELLTEFYTTKITLNFLNHDIDLNKLISFIDSLSFNSNTIINLITINNSNYIFQIIGKSENIKNAINILTSFQSIINNNLISEQISYQIELPNFEKDFIAGKKNGKIIKIMNMSSVNIKILPFNDYSLIIKINCNNLIDSILGLGLFEDELPKILTFNVPESFHRQIIGVGGQTIQTIMRKFNVFIKFSNSFELNENSNNDENANNNSNNNHSQQLLNYSNFQQSFIRKNNVVIKCPSKNKDQIILAKLELERLVDKVIKLNYNCSKIKLLNSQWKLLTNGLSNLEYYINKKKPTNFITELEKYTNTFIKFPLIDDIEFNQLFINLEIFGVDNNSKNCCNELHKLLPYEYKISIDLNDIKTNEKMIKISKFLKNFKNILDDNVNDKIENDEISINFLNNIIIPLKLMYNVELLIDEDNSNIRLFYFTDSFDKFDKSDNITTANINNEESQNEPILNLISSKVLTLVEQTKFIENSKDFQFMINTLTEFLNSNGVNIKFQSVCEPTFIVEHLHKNNKTTDKDFNNNGIESVNNNNSGNNNRLLHFKQTGNYNNNINGQFNNANHHHLQNNPIVSSHIKNYSLSGLINSAIFSNNLNMNSVNDDNNSNNNKNNNLQFPNLQSQNLDRSSLSTSSSSNSATAGTGISSATSIGSYQFPLLTQQNQQINNGYNSFPQNFEFDQYSNNKSNNNNDNNNRNYSNQTQNLHHEQQFQQPPIQLQTQQNNIFWSETHN